ncbi:MAG: type IV secretory system conjugative DNA transfer family protein, partial [bacterium]|nr:type IV secretory system conjugative DNA transfer family protein [bacterium]
DAKGKPFLLTCDSSILVLGPPGSGKDRRVAIPLLEAWPGPALATSTKVDLALATVAARARRGPVAVFDPAGFGLGGPEPVRWNPVLGCQDRDVAARRAAAIIAGGTGPAEKFWDVLAARVLRACLAAAAWQGEGVLEAARFASSLGGWSTAATILRANGESEWAAGLDADADLDPRTSSSIMAAIAASTSGLSNSRLRVALTPTDSDTDPAAVIAAGGTIYAVAPAEPDGHLVFRPWTTLLASEVAAVLREQAHGERLCPPALLLLNELVHVCPLPELPGLLADGRGHNIATVAIVQDPAQLAARYDADEAKAIIAAAQHRLLLAANGDDTAREWSELIGKYHITRKSTTHKTAQMVSESSSTSLEERPIMAASELRHLPYGCGVLLPRGFPSMPLQLQGS